MYVLCRDELDGTGLDLSDAALDLVVPGCVRVGILAFVERVQQFFRQARAIFHGQSLGSRGKLFDDGRHGKLR